MSPTPHAEALSALSRFLVADASIGETLHRVAQIAVDAMPGAKFAGISMFDDGGKASTAIFTDDHAPEIDQSQYDSGAGPCLDAWREKRVVRVDDIDAGRRDYPEFAAAAAEHGVLSTLSLPLVATDTALGALNLYAADKHAFSSDDESVGLELGRAAAIVLSNSVAYWGAYELSQQLQEAMRSRAVIEQAKGILMAQSRELAPDDAFDMLRQASQRENVKLREVAQRVVDRRPITGGG